MKIEPGHMDTREKILKKAACIFSEKGFKETTIRMIAEAAGVNVAAVNYHFGGKKELYLSVVRYWAEDALRDYPLDKLTDSAVSSEDKIRLFICHTLRCLLGRNGKGTGFGRLLAMEASISPSDLVSEVITDTIGRPTKCLYQAVADLTKLEDPEKVQIYTACIVGQTVYFYLSRNLTDTLFHIKAPSNSEEINRLCDTVYEFTMRAING